MVFCFVSFQTKIFDLAQHESKRLALTAALSLVKANIFGLGQCQNVEAEDVLDCTNKAINSLQ